MRVLVNGDTADVLTTSDRGLLYGDGLFETIACFNGRPQHWQQHMQRLQAGCKRLGLGDIDTDLLLQEGLDLCSEVRQGVLKIILTRGTGGRGYRPPEQLCLTRILQLHEWPACPESNRTEGIRTITCQTRLGHNPYLAGIKHLNRLMQVMARREWVDDDIGEGLMLDVAGHVIEGTMTNLFMTKGDVLLTPDLTQCGVAGIMRAQVIETANQEHITTDVREITVNELQQADEVFVCNSVVGIWPVRRHDAFEYKVGPLTTRLQSLLADIPGNT